MKPWLLWFSLLLFVSEGYGMELWVTGDMAGEIRPCGCSAEGQRGGIERLSAYLKSKPQKAGLWVDLGNFSVAPTHQGQLKNGLYAKLFRDRHLFAMLPGPKEFSTGKRGIAKLRAPYLLTNRRGEIAYTERVKHRHGWQFFGYLSPDYFNQGTHKTALLEGPSAFLERAKKLRSAEWKGILLFRGNQKELTQFEASGLFQRILLANDAVSEKEQILELKRAGKIYYKPPIQGQGVLEYNLEKQVGKVSWLNPDSPLDPAWKQPFATYDKQVESLFMSFLKEQEKAADKRVYKGSSYCVTCHIKAGEVWSKSKHGRAFASLEKAGRQYDPDCIACHTQGFNKGGFLSKELTPGLENVGCENCHGLVPDDHAQNPAFKKNRKPVSQLVCTGCHLGNHSPHFRFETYFPKIQH